MAKRARTKWLVVHAADTYARMDIGRDEIDLWHRKRGWAGCGYHFVLRRDGTVETGRDMDATGAHVKGFNHNSIGICMVGGRSPDNKPQDNFSVYQKDALAHLLFMLVQRYPDADVVGHRDFVGVKKACPCFDVREWWAQQAENPNC